MNHFHFMQAYWLWGILPLIALGLYLGFYCQPNNIWQRVCDPQLYAFLMKDSKNSSSRLPLILFLLGCFFALIALSGPAWKRVEIPLFNMQKARMIVLDLSQSMNAKDITPSRLERAKYKIRDILSNLQEGQVGLIVFSGEAFVVSPLTQDSQTIDAMIPMLTQDVLPLGGEDIGTGIDKAAELLKQAGEPQGDILLLTDNEATASAFDAAKRARKMGYVISILGIGKEGGVPLPLPEGGFEKEDSGQIKLHYFSSASLKTLADIGGGQYVAFSDDDRDIKQLLDSQLSAHFSKKTQLKSVWDRFEDEGHWFVLPIVCLSLWGFRRGRFETL